MPISKPLLPFLRPPDLLPARTRSYPTCTGRMDVCCSFGLHRPKPNFVLYIGKVFRHVIEKSDFLNAYELLSAMNTMFMTYFICLYYCVTMHLVSGECATNVSTQPVYL